MLLLITIDSQICLSVVSEKQISAAFGSVQTEKISAEWFAINAFTSTWKSTMLVSQRASSTVRYCGIFGECLPCLAYLPPGNCSAKICNNRISSKFCLNTFKVTFMMN